jgi:hypothetical protein
MRRTLLVVVSAVALVLGLAGPAAAESVTVAGAPGGYITKMTVNNAQSALTTKVYGLGNKCVARFLRVDIRYGQGQKYHVEAGCTTTGKWFQYLFFKQSQVRCPKFGLTYAAATSAWKVFIPRSCLTRAPDRLRVYAEGANASGTAFPGVAGPTKVLRRG